MSSATILGMRCPSLYQEFELNEVEGSSGTEKVYLLDLTPICHRLNIIPTRRLLTSSAFYEDDADSHPYSYIFCPHSM